MWPALCLALYVFCLFVLFHFCFFCFVHVPFIITASLYHNNGISHFVRPYSIMSYHSAYLHPTPPCCFSFGAIALRLLAFAISSECSPTATFLCSIPDCVTPPNLPPSPSPVQSADPTITSLLQHHTNIHVVHVYT